MSYSFSIDVGFGLSQMLTTLLSLHLAFTLVLLRIASSSAQLHTNAIDCNVTSDGEDICLDAKRFEELFRWMQDGMDAHVPEQHRQGLPRLHEVIARKNRTFVANRDLHPGELLLRFPRQRLMHSGYYIDGLDGTQRSLTAALAEALVQKIVHIAPQTWLALYIMEHRHLGRNSEWHPYLNLLPLEFAESPIFYTEKEFSWLEGSSFVPRAKKHLDMLKAQFDTVAELVPGFVENYTLAEFLWARSAIATRVFGWDLPGLPSGHNDFMVPLGDMFNHRSPKQLEWIYNESTDTLDYWVRENVSANSELLISYGTKSNGDYLLYYGFTVPGLPQRSYPVCSVKLALGIDGIPDQEAKRKWLIKASFTKVREHEPFEVKLRETWEKDPQKMLEHARFLVLPNMSEVERQIAPAMKNCKRIAIPPGSCEKPISKDNERAALEYCLRLMKLSLRAYPTTLQEDEDLLPSLSGLQLSLVTLRRDEKIVFHWWERYLALALEMLELAPSQIEQRCKAVLGDSQCTSEDNWYMNVTIYELLGGIDAEPKSNQFFIWAALIVTVAAATILPRFMKVEARKSNAAMTTASGDKSQRSRIGKTKK
mmetsp:Transcript_101079/g.159343  ORF Transcript_101079/g.159343 Transcript_101079/m.159343 type:complete len:595 (+) Transcript_101079:19-1803(+)